MSVDAIRALRLNGSGDSRKNGGQVKTELRFGLLLAAGLLVAAKAPKMEALKPLSNPGEWVTPDDYPTSAMRAGKTGTTAFKLDVSPDGTVTKCTIMASSGTPELDEAACTLVTARARFSPAKMNGKPVTATYSNRVVWSIPEDAEDAPYTPENIDIVMDFDVMPDGTVLNCMALNAKTGEPMDNGCADMGPVKRKPPRPYHIRMRNTVEVTEKTGQ